MITHEKLNHGCFNTALQTYQLKLCGHNTPSGQSEDSCRLPVVTPQVICLGMPTGLMNLSCVNIIIRTKPRTGRSCCYQPPNSLQYLAQTVARTPPLAMLHTHTHANGEPLSDVVSKLFTAVILLWDVLGDYHKAIYSYIMLLPQLSNKKLLGL